MKQQGLRFNNGKVRHELLPQFAVNEVAKIFTYGANKYTVKDENGNVVDGSDNWKIDGCISDFQSDG